MRESERVRVRKRKRESERMTNAILFLWQP